ncbi:hypothetical protein BH10ACT1_BH10ACT1_01360 [soil metagenome]
MDGTAAPSPSTGDPSDASSELLADGRLTAMGLLVETYAGVTDVFERELETLGVSGSAFEVMIRLARSDQHRLRMTELAAQSTLTSSGLTRLIDRLEHGGLVAREPCETDRRGYFAVLTPAGLAKVEGVLPAHLQTIDRILTGVLDPEELSTFLTVLRKVRSVVKPDSDPEVAASVADA